MKRFFLFIFMVFLSVYFFLSSSWLCYKTGGAERLRDDAYQVSASSRGGVSRGGTRLSKPSFVRKLKAFGEDYEDIDRSTDSNEKEGAKVTVSIFKKGFDKNSLTSGFTNSVAGISTFLAAARSKFKEWRPI